MKLCPSCKKSNTDSALECVHCLVIFEKWSNRAQSPSPAIPEREPSKISFGWFKFRIALLLLAFGSVIFFRGKVREYTTYKFEHPRAINNDFVIHATLMGSDIGSLREGIDKHGADPNYVVQGQSLLFRAVNQNNIEAVQFLISRKANLNRVDGEGKTPLQVAREKKFLEIAQVLVSAGAMETIPAGFIDKK